MKPLTDKQKQLLIEHKEDLKAITLEWCNYTEGNKKSLADDFDDFAKQFEEKEVLFVTEDGVDIYDGDRYIWISKKALKIVWAKAFKGCGLDSNCVYYSSPDKAEEYVLLNSPKLCIADVEDQTSDKEMYLSDRQKNLLKSRLINLVKAKSK